MLRTTTLIYILTIFSMESLVLSKSYVLQDDNIDKRMHPAFNFKPKRIQKRAMPSLKFQSAMPEEDFSAYWNGVGQDILKQQLRSKNNFNKNMAKNVIMFLGDGMSIPTITAGRVYLGGEEKQFSFEKFDYTGLSKTYCANTQVADSACTATAYLGGVKANYGTIGLSAAVEFNDCWAQNNSAYHVSSIAEWAQSRGMATGLITTTAITHASPAGIYAHTANRDWENDAEVLSAKGDLSLCPDIAAQLINGQVGRNLSVILGGGRAHFMPIGQKDVSGKWNGKRLDSINLVEQWKQKHGPNAYYVEKKADLMKLPITAERVLGLFAENHMPYHLDADLEIIPTLSEMVAVALDILERQSSGRGFFLFVEGGRIDHAHHDTQAMKALDETVEFDKAISLARARTKLEDTLIVVTSDHSHTMSVAGYSSRKNDIFGINNGQLGTDHLPYATLSYANGPGFENNFMKNGSIRRKNLLQINMKNKNYKFPTTVPLDSETHGGDDVAVFASGPFSHLFTGVYEQNFIPHAMGYAACLGNGTTACTDGLHSENRF